jgi:hypothetical protein
MVFNMTIQTKIFIGYSIDKPMRLHLEKSTAWKEDKVTNQPQLTEIRFHEKDYIGTYLPNCADTPLIEQKEKEIRTLLQHYCPKLILDKQNAFIFPQIFLG